MTFKVHSVSKERELETQNRQGEKSNSDLYNVAQWSLDLMCLVVLRQVDVLTKEQKMCFPREQRCFIEKHYFLNQRSYVYTKTAFEERWLEINLQKTLIRYIIIRFEQQHTVADLPKNRRLRVWTTEFEQHISIMLVATSHISSRCLVQHMNVSYSTTLDHISTS